MSAPRQAHLLTCVTLSYGGTKVQKWMAVCDGHYGGGPAYLLTEIPEMFVQKK